MKNDNRMRLPAAICLYLTAGAFMAAFAAEDEETERYRQIIRYGTDTEITKLIQTLKAENIESLDGELTALLKETKSPAIRGAAVAYFADRESKGAAAITLEFLQTRDTLDPALIAASIEYAGKIANADAVGVLRDIIQGDELRYQNAAIRALGRAVKNSGDAEKEKTAAFLREFYQGRTNADETRRLILEAMGEGELSSCADFLQNIIDAPEENSMLRVEALNSAGKLGESRAGAALKSAVIASLNAPEPLVRTAAVGALGAFSGKESDAALMDALRDSFFRTRLAAVKALSSRKLDGAIDFLVFRAKNDEAASVREEAARTLAAYQSAKADDALESVYTDVRSGEKIRLMAAEALIKNNASKYTKKLISDMEEARKSRQKSWYTGLLKALSFSTASEMQALAESLLRSTDALDQAFALDIIGNNRFKRFLPDVTKIAEDPKNSLRRKANLTLEKL